MRALTLSLMFACALPLHLYAEEEPEPDVYITTSHPTQVYSCPSTRCTVLETLNRDGVYVYDFAARKGDFMQIKYGDVVGWVLRKNVRPKPEPADSRILYKPEKETSQNETRFLPLTENPRCPHYDVFQIRHNLFVRTGPDENFSPIARLVKGEDDIAWAGDCADGWVYVSISEVGTLNQFREGWISLKDAIPKKYSKLRREK